MVGTLFLACTLSLSPDAEPASSIGTRGVMSDAVAFHVRTTSPRVQEWLEIGAAESQTFRQLLQTLGESDLIVHVQLVDRLNTAGQTYFVTSTATVRYVRVEVARNGNDSDMIALIGHELQHAVEIAQAPDIRDRQTLAQFYRRLAGNSTSRSEYDSADARVMEDRVRRELAGFNPTAANSAAHTVAVLKRRDHAREAGR